MRISSVNIIFLLQGRGIMDEVVNALVDSQLEEEEEENHGGGGGGTKLKKKRRRRKKIK